MSPGGGGGEHHPPIAAGSRFPTAQAQESSSILKIKLVDSFHIEFTQLPYMGV